MVFKVTAVNKLVFKEMYNLNVPDVTTSNHVLINKLIHNLFFSKVDANNVIADEINPPYAKLRL